MPQKPSQASQAYRDSHAYIPSHVQEAMAKQLASSLPAHMKGYAGAFVQQNLVNPPGGSAPTSGRVSSPPPNYKPVTHLPRKDHFHQYKPQTPSRADTFLPGDTSTQPPSAPTQSAYPEQSPSSTSYLQEVQTSGNPQSATPNYDFFMSSEQPTAKKFSLPGSNSLAIRIGLISGGLLILLILFSVIKGLVSGPSIYPYYLSVMQDQQSIVHLSQAALQEPSLNAGHKNFAATSKVSVQSSQTDLINFLGTANKKVNPKQLNLKIDTSTDNRLDTASGAGNYNAVFSDVMQDQLRAYMQDLKSTYSKVKSTTAKQKLSDQYDQAVLLDQQLESANIASN